MKTQTKLWLNTYPSIINRINVLNIDDIKSNTFITDNDMGSCGTGWLHIGSVDITYNITANQAELTKLAIDVIKSQIADEQSKHYQQIQNLKQKIADLSCLTFNEPTPFNDSEVKDKLQSAFQQEEDNATCLITGCGLRYGDLDYWGDLFVTQDDENFLFNGAILPCMTLREDIKMLIVDENTSMKASGTIRLIPKENAELNEVALAYLHS